MSYCCCSLAGTSACDHCANRPPEWPKFVYVNNPPFTVDTTNFPPQEFVPVVRCKDCKYFRVNYMGNNKTYDCMHDEGGLFGLAPECFCSFGEKRGKEHD